MIRISSLSLLLILTTPRGFSQSTDWQAVRSTYETKLAETEELRAGRIRDLGERYADQLDGLTGEFQQRGDLEAILTTRAQQRAGREGEEPPGLPEDAPPELARLRELYDRARSQIDQSTREEQEQLRERYLAYLEIAKRDLTRSNRIEEALEVSTEIGKLQQPEAAANDPLQPVAAPGTAPSGSGGHVSVEKLVPSPRVVLTTWTDRRVDHRNQIQEPKEEGRNHQDGPVFVCRGGRFRFPELGATLSNALKEANAFVLVAEFEPANTEQKGPARILSLSAGAHARNLTLGQQENRLVLRLRTTDTDTNGTRPEILFGELSAGVRTRIALAYTNGRLLGWQDGRELDLPDISGDLSNWEPMELILGNEYGEPRPWLGNLHGFGLYNQFPGDRNLQGFARLIGQFSF